MVFLHTSFPSENKHLLLFSYGLAVFSFWSWTMDSNPSKCNADERCLLRLDAAEHLFGFKGAKCKSSPISSIIKIAILLSL